ncbi:hypothetical protein GOP47_0019184 [Adiantum capillus-veneris]|uniref:Retrotransposon gag domain-containing protein n=1 Tax=Adiantum capillus-veneris TaxID=13818 RepID=A0A9D4UES7_ADICA|nr:hypothetical protein GOP47_0019184 [Adiantum capillus-veneris]
MQQQQAFQQQYQQSERIRQARYTVTEKLQRFEGRDISKFCTAYEQSMEDYGVNDHESVEGFHLITAPELRARIEEIWVTHGANWQEFKKALQEEYFLEDSQRVTKQSFMKWIQQKDKGLSARELLRAFEKKFQQLSTAGKKTMQPEKVELFIQVADSHLQKSLVHLLEDPSGELGLTSNWKLVTEAVNMIVKRQKRVDKFIVADPMEVLEEDLVEKPKPKLEEPVLDELVKGIQELNLNLKAVKLDGLSTSGSSSEPRQRPPQQDWDKGCMWCDSLDHIRKNCDDFNEAYKKNTVFWKDGKLHLKETGERLHFNYGKGGMKKLVKEMQHNASRVDATTYGLQVCSAEDEESTKAKGNLWPYSLRTADKGKITRDTLSQAGNYIRQTTGWSDPIDSLFVYAFLAKSQANEAMVEEKLKRDEDIVDSSKRATRTSGKKEEGASSKAVPTPEVVMEEASKVKKQGVDVVNQLAEEGVQGKSIKQGVNCRNRSVREPGTSRQKKSRRSWTAEGREPGAWQE